MSIIQSIVSVITAVCCLLTSNIFSVFPYFSVIPDLVKVGVDYIQLDRNTDATSKKELIEEIDTANAQLQHPFVLADKENFDTVKAEYKNNTYSDYTFKLNSSAIQNADRLLNTDIWAPLPYELDEENSILPISRETINRIVILGYAWQATGEVKYAERAWLELENVCNYDDWCPSHFLATAEMALAASIGYDWFFDYLTKEQKNLLAEKTWEYAIKPALSKNYLANWFTWSKTNWNSICYSGIGIACMTFSHYNPEDAAEFLTMCYKNMPIAFETFTPDGVYAEGPGYSQSGMNALIYFIATSKNYFGTDFGMSEIDGLEQLGYFPVYITAPAGVFNYGDNKNRTPYTPVLHWYASEFDKPLLACFQMSAANSLGSVGLYPSGESVEQNGTGKESALNSLWYDRSYTEESSSFEDEPLSVLLKSDVGQTLAIMRSEYLNPNATYAAIKGGYNYTNHGDLDIGTFVFDSMGERWAEELGPGKYDAPSYFVNLPAGGRWKNYCKRAEGQNTLVINPSMTLDDQYALAESEFTSFEETADGGKCVLDMTDAYAMNQASNVQREFELYNNRTSLKITDTVDCRISSEIYWFMHTKADITVAEDGKSAILTINGKQMQATLHNDGVFSVMAAEALGGAYEYDDEYTDIKKLTVHLENVKEATICVTLEPVTA